MNNKALIKKLRVGDPPAPGNLVLLEGFLNTWSGELDIDDFKTARSTDEWLRSVGLWTISKKVTAAQVQEVVKFRSDLRVWILDKKSVEPLNNLAAGIPYQATFDPEGNVQFHPDSNGIHQVLGRLISIISQSQQEGTWDRFKCCELPSCGWAYYDATRSRTKRWCSMKTCGSRHKSREYYKRQR